MKLIASGKWSKEKQGWSMVVAMPQRERETTAAERKAPKRATVVSLFSRRKQPA